jgi:hypothetical protein
VLPQTGQTVGSTILSPRRLVLQATVALNNVRYCGGRDASERKHIPMPLREQGVNSRRGSGRA